MAITKCKRCGAQVGNKVGTCPQCGTNRKKTSGCVIVIVIVIFLVITFLGAIAARNTDKSGSSGSSTVPQSSTPEQVEDPAVVLAEDTQAVTEIEERLKDNADKLKKYYASAGQVKQSSIDIIRLGLIKGTYFDSKNANQKALGKSAAKLLPRVEQQARSLYASSLSEIFVKSGMDIQVNATGKDKKRLRISYALMSRPLVYKFQNEIEIDRQAAPLGFTQIVYTDGFESSLGETWTVNL